MRETDERDRWRQIRESGVGEGSLLALLLLLFLVGRGGLVERVVTTLLVARLQAYTCSFVSM